MTPELERKLTIIAVDNLEIPTLEARGSDSHDFHDCSVWGIKRALEQAYALGLKESGKKRK